MPREHRELHERKLSPKASNFLSKINSDIRALNSSILILSQKMKYIVRNEKILGRNLVVLNKKIKEFAVTGTGFGENSQTGNGVSNELANLNLQISACSNSLAELRLEIDSIKETFAKQEEVKELKFIIDQINPLEFVSRKDLQELLETDSKKHSRKKN